MITSRKTKVLLALLGLATSASLACASDLVSYTASDDPNNNPDANGNTVDVWTVTHSGTGAAPDNYGTFLGDSGQNGGGSGAGAGSSAWGLYANHDAPADGTNEVDIGHTFDGGALTIGQSVSINFDGGYADTGDGYGLRLFGPSGFVFSLAFTGGGAYQYYDATASGAAAGFGYSPNGFNFQYSQLTLTTYSVVVTDTTGMIGSFTGTVSGAPDFIQVYNNAAGSGSNYDVFANNLQIVPEPTSIALLICGALVLLYCVRFRRRGLV